MKHSAPLFANLIAGVGVSITPQTVASGATVNGDAIVEPWMKTRQLVFSLAAGEIAGTMVLALEARQRGTSTWVAINDPNGNPLTLSGARYDNGGQLDGGAVVATLLTNRLGSHSIDDFHQTYDAVRITATAGGGTAELAVSHTMFDTDIEPAEIEDVNDDLAALMLVGRTS